MSAVELSADAAALVAALAGNVEVDQVFAPPWVWDEVRTAFPGSLVPEPEDEDGTFRIGESRCLFCNALDQGATHCPECGAFNRSEPATKAEPAYTVVGRYGDGQTWIGTVYSFEGPKSARKLAHEACADEADQPVSEMAFEAIAIFEGEPAVVARDDEGPAFVQCGRCGEPGCDPTLERHPGEGVICDECRDGEAQ